MVKVILSANTDWYLYNFRRSFADFLREQGFDVVLVSPSGEYKHLFEEQGFKWIQWEVGRQSLVPWKEIPSFVKLARIYRQEKVDLVHHHTIKPVLYGSLTARGIGLKNVVNSITGRGYVFLGKGLKPRLLRFIVNNMYRLALNYSNYTAIFENEIDQDYFIQHKFLPANRTWLIPGVGVDPQRFVPSPESGDVPVVLLSGRLLWDKGVGVLVDAARILHTNKTVRIVLVGKPDPGNPASIERETLEGWVHQGIVEWWGWQPDMNKVYAQSHVVVVPTMYGEGVPTVLLEAAACGRPVVATDMPGCQHAVLDGHNGLIVPPNDPTALAKAINTLISDSTIRGRMGAAGRQLILEKFTTTHVNTATFGVYRQILGLD